jgi:O-acetyl-ADP-ribose deacetylase (regulator of RNase III)
LLASCYRTALSLAAGNRLASIAFPAISTGIYRFPPERAERVAVGTVAAEIAGAAGMQRVVFCCFSPDAAAHHRDARGVEPRLTVSSRTHPADANRAR